MKKYQYIVALACVLVGAVGFTGIYLTNQAEEREAELAKQQQILQENQEIAKNAEKALEQEEIKEQEEVKLPEFHSNQTVKEDSDSNTDGQSELLDVSVEDCTAENTQPDETKEETVVGTIVEEKLSFEPERGLVWPVEGSVLLDYSMESTIFFPTLQQYQYNPAMVISGNVNDKVYFAARGKITNIETNEVTGCTVTQDIGDGYTAIYGQLKELNFEVGDMVESGQVVGYISEPTKYYSTEGSNVYFQLLKDGVPVDPEEILP